MTDETLIAMRVKALAAARTVLGTCDRGDNAEDIAQLAILQAWRQRALVLSGEDASAWVYHVARNYARMSRRSRRSRAECSLSPSVPCRDSIERRTYAAEVLRIAQSLPDLQHSLQGRIMRATISGCNQHQIAADLGLHIKALQQHLYRARRTMRCVAGSLYFNDRGE